MYKTSFLRALLPCALLSVAACGGDDPKPVDDDVDNVEEETPVEGDVDSGVKPGKMDSGTKPTPTADAGVKSDAGSTPGKPADTLDGGKSDAGKPDTSKPDAGKPDTSKPDSSVPPPPPPPGEKLPPKCVKKPSQVMIIGDSYINWITHTFGPDLAAEAKQTWRMEAVGGYSMGSGGIGSIPAEFDTSIARDPDAHTILMTGGGNDVLVADPTLDLFGVCKTDASVMTPNCQTIIDKAIAAADKLLLKASAAGIRDVVYFFYPHVPNGTALGGPNPNAILDKALPQVRDFCAGVEGKTGGKTRCHFLDLVPVFEGHTDWFVAGDIHENSMGSAAMAKAVWKLMKDNCIGQPESSGCCE